MRATNKTYDKTAKVIPTCTTCHRELGVRYFTQYINGAPQAIACVGWCGCVDKYAEFYIFPDWRDMFDEGRKIPSLAPPVADVALKCDHCHGEDKDGKDCKLPIVSVWRYVETVPGVWRWQGGAGICPHLPSPKLTAGEIDGQWAALRAPLPGIVAGEGEGKRSHAGEPERIGGDSSIQPFSGGVSGETDNAPPEPSKPLFTPPMAPKTGIPAGGGEASEPF